MTAGRDLIFESPEELSEKIEGYFAKCDARAKEIVLKDGARTVVADPEPYQIQTLAAYLKVTMRTLSNYEKREEFFPTIKIAKEKIEGDQAKRLVDRDKFTPGLIFSLKNNYGWVDKTEVDTSITFPTGITINFVAAKKEEQNEKIQG